MGGFTTFGDFWDPEDYLRRIGGAEAQSPIAIPSGPVSSSGVRSSSATPSAPPEGPGQPPGGPFTPVPDLPPWIIGGGGGGGGGIPGYTGPMSPIYNFTKAPMFKAPASFQAPDFGEWTPPNAAAVLAADPGYQFRLEQGLGAIQNSAAAKGILNSGGTLKDLQNYGQNLASQEYGNVFNRNMQQYEAKYKGALDAYNSRYTSAKDEFTPRFSEWQTLTGAEQARAMAEFQRYWDIYALGVSSKLARNGAIDGLLGGGPSNPPPPPPQGY